MSSSTYARQLDLEHTERIKSIYEKLIGGTEIDIFDTFHSSGIREYLGKSKVILRGFDYQSAFVNFPFTQAIFAYACADCLDKVDTQIVRDLIERANVIPILVSDYVDYREDLLKVLTGNPHISLQEFLFFRFSVIIDNHEGGLCPHCVKQRQSKIKRTISRYSLHEPGDWLLNRVMKNLAPYIGPDLELLDLFHEATRKKDVGLLHGIAGLSDAVCEIRTCEVFNSRCPLPTADIRTMIGQLASTGDEFRGAEMEDVTDAIASAASFEVPVDVDPAQYFKKISRYREELAGVVDNIVKADNGSQVGAIELAARIQELNTSVRKLSKNKRYLLYRAGLSFIKGNKALVASTLMGATVGAFAGLWACGVSVAAGKMADCFAKKKGGIVLPPSIEEFFNELADSLRPKVHKLIASYTGAPLHAIQLQEISRGIEDGPRKS